MEEEPPSNHSGEAKSELQPEKSLGKEQNKMKEEATSSQSNHYEDTDFSNIFDMIKRPSTKIGSEASQLSMAQLECTIYRVYGHLRNINEKAYEPEVIAIGPYHRGKDNLKMMEEHKWRYLNLICQKKIENFNECCSAIAPLGHEARKCYADPINLDMGEFVRMLVLDGCFIIELLRKVHIGDSDDPITQMGWMINSVQRDLMLFENQIPFFVLCKLFELIDGGSQHEWLCLLRGFFNYPIKFSNRSLDEDRKSSIGPLIRVFRSVCHVKEDKKSSNKSPHDGKESSNRRPDLKRFFRSVCHVKEDKESSNRSPHEGKESSNRRHDLIRFFRSICHIKGDRESSNRSPHEGKESSNRCHNLIRFFRSVCHVKEDIENSNRHPGEEIERSNRSPDKIKHLLHLIRNDLVSSFESDLANREKYERKQLRDIKSATLLAEANVRFQRNKGTRNLFDIKFERGTLLLPTLIIDDGTESLFRNLIAYEQYFHTSRYKCVTDYVLFFDCLINSSKDVQILSHCGIVRNCLGNDEVPAEIFNRLTDSVVVSDDDFIYGEIFDKVEEHCSKRWNKRMAKLRRNYFNSPWAVISFIAAVVLLLLTIAQTVLSALSL